MLRKLLTGSIMNDITEATSSLTHGPCTMQCSSGDWFAKVKQENLSLVKQEPNDVCEFNAACHNKNDAQSDQFDKAQSRTNSAAELCSSRLKRNQRPRKKVGGLMNTEYDAHVQSLQKEDAKMEVTAAHTHSVSCSTSRLPHCKDQATVDKGGFTCPVCKKNYQSYHIKRHMRIHTGERPFTCSICYSQFSQPGNLHRHMAVHTGQRRYSCHLCEKTFTSSYNLKIHVRTHTGEHPFTCGVCERRFIQSGNLKLHMRVHTKERPYRCNKCARTFVSSADLNVHLRTHTGERPFTCYICDSKFAQAGGLKRHMLTHLRRGPDLTDRDDELQQQQQ